jgi:hypothetical protein
VQSPFLHIARGVTRIVLLIGPWAIKLPRLHRCATACYPSCARSGFHANRVEAERWRNRSDHEAQALARVIAGGAWLLVMERCEPVAPGDVDFAAKRWDGIINPADRADKNFGRTSGRLVAIDYAYW